VSELPNGWTRASLDAIADVLDFEREPINSSERNSRINGKSKADLYPYYGATGQVGFIDSFRSEGLRVLLGEDAAPFLDPVKDKAYLANGRFWVNNHAHVLAGAAGLIDNRYLCHQLNTVDYHPFVTGTTRLKLTSSAMKQIPMAVAPAAEQTLIVEKLEELLSDLDAGVAELKAAQKKLGQYRQSLLKAAVEGALTADWRKSQKAKPAESGAQLLKRILGERRTRWEAKQLAKFKEQGKTPVKGWQSKYVEPVAPDTAGLPELPEGWVWASVDQLSESVRNGLSKTPNTDQRGFPIFKINAVRPMTVNFTAIKHIEINKSEATDYWVEVGDVLATRYNGSVDLLGVFGMVKDVPERTLYPDKLIRMKPVTGVKLGAWMEVCGNVGLSRKHLVSRVKTTAGQTGISGDDLKKTPIPLASVAEQEVALAVLEERLQAVKELERPTELGLKQASAQRKNILKAAFSGQLVPQDPLDEPASVLLARIRAERVKSEGLPKVRKSKIRKYAHA
jgi:type I restriction enzyme, S subunit